MPSNYHYTITPYGGGNLNRPGTCGLRNRYTSHYTIPPFQQFFCPLSPESRATKRGSLKASVRFTRINASFQDIGPGACCVCRPRSSLATAKGLANPPLCQHWVSRHMAPCERLERSWACTPHGFQGQGLTIRLTRHFLLKILFAHFEQNFYFLI